MNNTAERILWLCATGMWGLTKTHTSGGLRGLTVRRILKVRIAATAQRVDYAGSSVVYFSTRGSDGAPVLLRQLAATAPQGARSDAGRARAPAGLRHGHAAKDRVGRASSLEGNGGA